MKDVTADLIRQLANFAELPLAEAQIPKVQANLNSVTSLLEMLDHLDMSEIEPVTTFSAEWEES